MEPDRSWMYKRNNPSRAGMIPEFAEGVTRFVNHAKTLDPFLTSGLIRCPCVKCENVKYQTAENVSMHLMLKGFKPGYTVWTSHGEVDSDNRFDNFVVGKNSRSTKHYNVQSSRISHTHSSSEFGENVEETSNGKAYNFYEQLRDEESWVEPRAEETRDKLVQTIQEYHNTQLHEGQDTPSIEKQVEQFWQKNADDSNRGLVNGYTEKAYKKKKKSGFYCSSTSGFNDEDRAKLSEMQERISLLTRELAAYVERERKRDEQIATAKEAENKRYEVLQAQLNSLLYSRNTIHQCPNDKHQSLVDESDEEGDEE